MRYLTKLSVLICILLQITATTFAQNKLHVPNRFITPVVRKVIVNETTTSVNCYGNQNGIWCFGAWGQAVGSCDPCGSLTHCCTNGMSADLLYPDGTVQVIEKNNDQWAYDCNRNNDDGTAQGEDGDAIFPSTYGKVARFQPQFGGLTFQHRLPGLGSYYSESLHGNNRDDVQFSETTNAHTDDLCEMNSDKYEYLDLNNAVCMEEDGFQLGKFFSPEETVLRVSDQYNQALHLHTSLLDYDHIEDRLLSVQTDWIPNGMTPNFGQVINAGRMEDPNTMRVYVEIPDQFDDKITTLTGSSPFKAENVRIGNFGPYYYDHCGSCVTSNEAWQPNSTFDIHQVSGQELYYFEMTPPANTFANGGYYDIEFTLDAGYTQPNIVDPITAYGARMIHFGDVNEYSDVGDGKFYVPSLKNLLKSGLFDSEWAINNTVGLFGPNHEVTKGEVSKIMVEMAVDLDLYELDIDGTTFADVPKGYPSFPQVQTLKNKGALSAIADNKTQIDSFMQINWFCKMIFTSLIDESNLVLPLIEDMKYLEMYPVSVVNPNGAGDPNDYYVQQLMGMVTSQWTNSDGVKVFAPTAILQVFDKDWTIGTPLIINPVKRITRAETVVILDAVYNTLLEAQQGSNNANKNSSSVMRSANSSNLDVSNCTIIGGMLNSTLGTGLVPDVPLNVEYITRTSGEIETLTGAATDSNGDLLAYCWQSCDVDMSTVTEGEFHAVVVTYPTVTEIEYGTMYIRVANTYGDVSDVLVNITILPEGSTCNDGILNGNETSIDCGGDCTDCPATPTCNDGLQNGLETGVDCGGSCPDCIGNGFEWEYGVASGTNSGSPNYTPTDIRTHYDVGETVYAGFKLTEITNNMFVHVTVRNPGGSLKASYFSDWFDESGWNGYWADFQNMTSYQLDEEGTWTIKFTVRVEGESPYEISEFPIYVSGTCTDGQQNAQETGVDCGGPECDPCDICGPAGTTIEPRNELYAFDADDQDRFSEDIDIDGNYAVVSSRDDNVFGIDAGAAYLYYHNGTDWQVIKKLSSDDLDAGDRFGSSVDISGNRIVIGAKSESEHGTNAGAAYIFERNHGGINQWGQVTKLTASDADSLDYFGTTVTIDGEDVVVTANAFATDSSVYVFSQNHGGANNWGEVIKIADPIEASSSHASSIDIDEGVLVVGDKHATHNGNTTGGAFIYERNTGGTDQWGLVKKLVSSTISIGDWFGDAVAINHDEIVIGAPLDDHDNGSGRVFVFRKGSGGTNNWGQIYGFNGTNITNKEMLTFGSSVDISDDFLVVGTRIKDINTLDDQGAAFVHGIHPEYHTIDYMMYTTADDYQVGTSNDPFGLSIGVSGNQLLVGSLYDVDAGSNAGSLYPYTIIGGNGESCDDGDPCTINDVLDVLCNCVGVLSDSTDVDNDGVFDCYDQCIGFDNNLIGTACDDGDVCTTNDVYDIDCNCNGSYQDEDSDGVCDALDWCLGTAIGANIDSTGCELCIVSDSTIIVEEAKLLATYPSYGDLFGYAIDLDGDYAIIGMPFDDEIDDDAGAAYIYRFDGNQWVEVKKLTISGAEEDDNFGMSVSISDDVVVVGAPLGGSYNQGVAYIFSKDEGGTDNWGQVVSIEGLNSGSYDRFGISTSIDGEIIVVGAYLNDNPLHSGAAYVFSKNEGGADNWGQVKKLERAYKRARFGISVSISGQTIVIGSSHENGYSGTVYVYSKDEGGVDNWGQTKKLKASDLAASDYFGISVSIDGSLLAVGSYRDDGPYDSGSVYVFSKNHGGTNNWGEVKKLKAFDASASDNFGIRVLLENDLLAVGSCRDDAPSNSGAAYIFSKDEGGTDNWGELMKLKASDAGASDDFGLGIGLSEKHLLIGARYDDDGATNAGSVYYFSITPVIDSITCNDGDPCTIDDMYDADCNCIGISVEDEDSDGVCDSLDMCLGTPVGDTVDSDGCTIGQAFTGSNPGQSQNNISLRTIENVHQITLYPNPSTGRFMMEVTEDFPDADIIIYDISGRSVVQSKVEHKGSVKLEQPGMYIYRVVDENGILLAVSKLIVQ